jgi:phospho-N-acetylmuramoyl-pentapeptide-transferase
LLYWLLYEKLFPFFHPFRIFRYLTFRTAFASFTALLIGLFIGPYVIQKLREFQIGQYIREDGPQSHQKKSGTPTMGGLLIVIAIVLPTLLWCDPANPFIWITIFSTLAFGAIGFADDYIKVIKRRNLGLTARAKLFWQAVVAAAVASALAILTQFRLFSTELTVPFIKTWHPNLIWNWPSTVPLLGFLIFVPFIAFVIFVLLGSSNAVNLTDGLDGLAIGCTIIAAAALTVLTYVTSHVVYADYLELQRMPQVAELTVFCGSMVGASIGFLWYKRPPRRNLYGRRGLARPWRRHRHGDCHHSSGTFAPIYWRHLYYGSAFCGPAGGQLQIAQKAHFQNGPSASPL